LFVGFIGNLEGLVEAVYQRGLVPLSWIKWLDIKQLTDAPPTGGWTGGFWWWWRASRVIHDRDLLGNSVEVIDEFPFFSFLLGDMHPHVLALPFVLLAIAGALSLLLAARDRGQQISSPESASSEQGHAAFRTLYSAFAYFRETLGALTGLGGFGIVLYALIFGALGFLNTWDFPIYVALATLAIGAGLAVDAQSNGPAAAAGLTWATVRRAAAAGLALGVLGWLLYLPFYIGFQSQLGGLLPNLLFPSRFSQFLVMFGLFLAIMLPYLMTLSRAVPGRTWRRGTLFAFPLLFLAPLFLMAAFIFVFAVLPQGRAFIQTVLDNPAVKAAAGDGSFG